MLLLIVMLTIIAVGLAAIAIGEPRPRHEIVVWNDEAERKLLRERKVETGWW